MFDIFKAISTDRKGKALVNGSIQNDDLQALIDAIKNGDYDGATTDDSLACQLACMIENTAEDVRSEQMNIDIKNQIRAMLDGVIDAYTQQTIQNHVDFITAQTQSQGGLIMGIADLLLDTAFDFGLICSDNTKCPDNCPAPPATPPV